MVNMWFLETIDFFLIYDIFFKICFGIFILGYYYLVDAGYTNGKGFLAPYRGQRYHLNEWREGHMPTTHEEFFNMKHSTTRNVIERCLVCSNCVRLYLGMLVSI